MDPSSFTKTSFCSIEIDNITTNESKKYILNSLSLLCSNIKYNSRYAKVFNEQFSKNLNNPHIICLKSSGTPYLLYCTKINEVNYCFLIDKKVKVGYAYHKIFVTHYKFNQEVFNGTLFETELLKNNRVFIDRKSETTIDNSKAIIKWANQYRISNIRIVTSDYHMPRSMLILLRKSKSLNFYADPVVSDIHYRDTWMSNSKLLIFW